MRIGLLTDLAGQRTWHHWLAADLAHLGHALLILRPAPEAITTIPAGLRLAFWLDPVLYRLQGEHAFDTAANTTIIEHPAADAGSAAPLDLLIDVSARSGSRPRANRTIRLLFDDQSGELAAVSAVLDPGPVVIAIEDGSGVLLETSRPAIEQRTRLTSALDNVFTAVVELLTAHAQSRRERAVASAFAETANRESSPPRALRPHINMLTGPSYLTAIVSKKIARYLDRSTRPQNSWAIATRILSGEGLPGGQLPTQATYKIIPDDGRRYYSDPFLFEKGGRTHLFAEEYPMATGKGIISVTEIDEHGNAGAFRPIIERDFHLSYPFVFDFAGMTWMIPEASASGSVELYRAIDFPDRWAVDRTLLDGVPGCDATILQLGKNYYMVLTATRRRGSTWDKQFVYIADSPLGPWREHPPGLVCIDSTTARPAGAAFLRGDKVVRPAQNCSEFYGGSMTLLEPHQTAAGMLRETPVATIKVAGPSGIIGTHTYSRCRNIEAVDVYGDVSHAQSVTLACAEIMRSDEDDSAKRQAASVP